MMQPKLMIDEVLAILVEGCDALDIPIESWTRYNGTVFDPEDASGRRGVPCGTDGDVPDPQTYRYIESLETAGVPAPDDAVRVYSADRERAGWERVGYAAMGSGGNRTITVRYAGDSGFEGELVATVHKLTLRAISPCSADPAMTEETIQEQEGESATWRG